MGEFLFQPLLPISKISLATCQHPACKLNIGKVFRKKKKEKTSSASPLSLKDLSFCFQDQMFPHQPASQPILKPLKEQRTCQSHQWKERLQIWTKKRTAKRYVLHLPAATYWLSEVLQLSSGSSILYNVQFSNKIIVHGNLVKISLWSMDCFTAKKR